MRGGGWWVGRMGVLEEGYLRGVEGWFDGDGLCACGGLWGWKRLGYGRSRASCILGVGFSCCRIAYQNPSMLYITLEFRRSLFQGMVIYQPSPKYQRSLIENLQYPKTKYHGFN